ncbi:hypothetical protein [Herbaspirillum rhizosphaerae]|uniref:hypothetical protein n=1 Tax=Herbaspirillum rhizosphaerae TaxID=346179 RepID=UPI000A80EEC7|nr:hypothetical protein [Herbaspirillum rhizosphaerae]
MKEIAARRAEMAQFRQFLRNELTRGTRSGHADPVVVRYRTLAQTGTLDQAEALEYAQLFNRMYSRWRWRQATAQVLARKTVSQ